MGSAKSGDRKVNVKEKNMLLALKIWLGIILTVFVINIILGQRVSASIDPSLKVIGDFAKKTSSRQRKPHHIDNLIVSQILPFKR